MLPVTVVVLLLRLDALAVPDWLPSFFLHEYKLDIEQLGALRRRRVFFAGVVGDFARRHRSATRILRRTGDP